MSQSGDRYDQIGRSYARTRREDPRIAAEVHTALGPGSVVNVGAGSGNYEPVGRTLVAVEPSLQMIGQRDADRAPVLRAVAESLPLADGSFDVAMAVLTVHHWSDPASGLQEMARVAARQVVLYFEPLRTHRFWALEYFPAARSLPTELDPPGEQVLREQLEVRRVSKVLVPHDCTDGFGVAFWARPEAYLDPEVQAGMSWLAMLPQHERERGAARLRADLDSGEWDRRHGHLRPRDLFDGGYRIAVAGSGQSERCARLRLLMDVHLIDGTYELFRYHYSPANKDERRGATRGVVASCLMLLEQGATHVAVATDHVIESFRNDLWAGYKDGSGVDRDLKAQFPVVEDALRAAGFVVWPMVEQEADDAMAAGAKVAAADDAVDRAVICTPDKDLGQCVGGKVWQWDRRQDKWFDAEGVRARLGVPPASIPDLLSLVGDSADGFPGLPGWGAKSAAQVLDRWGHLEDIPADPLAWDAGVRSAAKLNATLRDQFELALLFRRIATVETDAEVGVVADWEWRGPTDDLPAVVEELGDDRLLARAGRLAEQLR